MRTILLVSLIVTSTLASTVQGGGEPVAGVHVAIRTYQTGLVSPTEQLSALSVAAEILKTAGLDLTWRICDIPRHEGSDACAEPLGSHELAIRLLRQPPPSDHVGRVQLGTSLIDTQTGSGSFATIYVDRIANLARSSRTRTDLLLGRAMAHEIGHLLLGTTEHASTGLMRAVWSTATLKSSDAGDWIFTPVDAQSMRDTLLFDTH
jgi:hypothetical protein